LLEIYEKAMQDLDAADNDDNIMEVYMNAMSNLKYQKEQYDETLPRSSVMSHNNNWDAYALEEFERDYEGYDDNDDYYSKGSHRSFSAMAGTAAETVYNSEFYSEEEYLSEEEWEEYNPDAFERASSIYQEEEQLQVLRKDTYRYDSHHDAEYRLRETSEPPYICCDSYEGDSDFRSYEPIERAPTSSNTSRMEIAPGRSARFRGSQETWEAVKRHALFADPCNCCGQLLHYINDADYFFCPDCDVVNPLEGTCSDGFDLSVGLGLRDADVRKWRVEYGRI
jgi:hypothetical protein